MFTEGEPSGRLHGAIQAVDTQGSTRLLQCDALSSDFINTHLELSELNNNTF
jgi:hypothetical protein